MLYVFSPFYVQEDMEKAPRTEGKQEKRFKVQSGWRKGGSGAESRHSCESWIHSENFLNLQLQSLVLPVLLPIPAFLPEVKPTP